MFHLVADETCPVLGIADRHRDPAEAGPGDTAAGDLGADAGAAAPDALQAQLGDDSLRWSIVAGTGFYLLAAGLFFLASRWIERDWED